MKKIYLCLLFRLIISLSFITSAPSSFAQITFQKSFANGNSTASSVQQTFDDGYIISGYAGGDAFLIKTDSSGNVIWNPTFGNVGIERGRSVKALPNGYIMAGTSNSFQANNLLEIYLTKIDLWGNIIWSKIYGLNGTIEASATDLELTVDGGFIICGWVSSQFPGLWYMKVDSIGNIIWSKQIACGSWCNYGANSIKTTSDGGYIMTGNGNMVIKLNSSGIPVWNKSYVTSFTADVRDAIETSDGGYLITGESPVSGASTNIYLIKTNSVGDTLWCRSYGGNNIEEARSVIEVLSGGYLVAGSTESFGNYRSAYVVRVDVNGNILWARTYGSGNQTQLSLADAFSVQATSDNGFIIAGATQNYLSGFSSKAFLIKTDSLGFTGCNEVIVASNVTVPQINLTNNGTSSSNFPLNILTPLISLVGGMSETIVCTSSSLFIASHPANASTCNGGSLSLFVTTSGSVANYMWRKNGVNLNSAPNLYGINSSTLTINPFTASDTGFYDVIITPVIGAPVISNSASASLISSPNATITSSGLIICSGSTVTLNADTGTGYSYQWQLNGNNISGAVSSSYQANIAGNYSVVVTNSCGSNTSNTITLTSGAAPSAAIIATGPVNFCSGGSVILDANTGTGLTYQWQLDGNNIADATSSSYSATATGNYSVIVSNNCGNSISNIITVNATAAPGSAGTISGPTSFCRHTTQTFSVTPVAGATNYVWSVPPQATITSGQGTNSVVVNFKVKQGDITVKAANQCGAGPLSVLPVQVLKCIQANNEVMREFKISHPEISIYPNPSSSKVTIQFNSETEKNYSLKLLDIHGRTVTEQNSVANQGLNEIILDIQFLNKGIYLVEIVSEKNKMIKKLVVS